MGRDKHLNIGDFQKGLHIEGVYLMDKLDLRQTKYGVDFFAFEISDRSGSLPARQWEASPEQFASLRDAPVVYVMGVVDEWQGEIQLKVTRVEAVEASQDELRHLTQHTPYNTDSLFLELKRSFETLSNPYLRKMFEKVFAKPDFVTRLKEAPAASSYHHAYLGGLLEHIVSLLRVSEYVCRAYPRLNRDFVMIGAFLHDIGKVEELSWERGFHYTTRGQLLGHIAIGTLMVDEWTRAIPGFPNDLRDELIHLILAHHGLREHGSPVLPCTPEALVVHFLDNLDGKLWSCYKAIDDTKSGTEEWSPYSRHMRRKIYRLNRVQEPSEVVPPLTVPIEQGLKPDEQLPPALEPGESPAEAPEETAPEGVADEDLVAAFQRQPEVFPDLGPIARIAAGDVMAMRPRKNGAKCAKPEAASNGALKSPSKSGAEDSEEPPLFRLS